MTNLKTLDERVVDIVKEKNKSEQEVREKIQEIYFKNIPLRFRNADIEKIDPKIRNLIFNFDGFKGLYLYGGCGTGKTYISYAIWKIMKLNKINPIIWNCPNLLREIRNGFNDNDWANDVFKDLTSHREVLIIDDLGSEKLTEWVSETLYLIINTRYEKMYPTFFTSNLSLKELAEKIGDRITSRIAEMCEVVKLDGNDKRLT